jgi:hypothetical protein
MGFDALRQVERRRNCGCCCFARCSFSRMLSQFDTPFGNGKFSVRDIRSSRFPHLCRECRTPKPLSPDAQSHSRLSFSRPGSLFFSVLTTGSHSCRGALYLREVPRFLATYADVFFDELSRQRYLGIYARDGLPYIGFRLGIVHQFIRCPTRACSVLPVLSWQSSVL